MSDNKQGKTAPGVVVFAPWWVYVCSLAFLVIFWYEQQSEYAQMYSMATLILLVAAFYGLARPAVWVGRDNVWIGRYFGFYWKKLPLKDIKKVLNTPVMGAGKMYVSRLQFGLRGWSAMDVPMASISASYAAGEYIKARIQALQNGTPPPAVSEVSGYGLLAPESLRTGWDRWRAPALGIALALTAAVVSLAAILERIGQ